MAIPDFEDINVGDKRGVSRKRIRILVAVIGRLYTVFIYLFFIMISYQDKLPG